MMTLWKCAIINRLYLQMPPDSSTAVVTGLIASVMLWLTQTPMETRVGFRPGRQLTICFVDCCKTSLTLSRFRRAELRRFEPHILLPGCDHHRNIWISFTPVTQKVFIRSQASRIVSDQSVRPPQTDEGSRVEWRKGL